jgi:transposase
MQRANRTAPDGFDPYDRRRLARALEDARDVRTYRRIQAVLLVARGWTVAQAAAITGARPWAVYAWVRRYRRSHRPDALGDAPRPGRPPTARHLTDARIVREFRRDPFLLGYATTTWTVALLARHLSQKYGDPIAPRTLRRRIRRLGLRWKRPRYAYATQDPHRRQKKGRSSAA